MIHCEFKRKFSLSMHKNMRIQLGEMTFSTDFTSGERGDLYPRIGQSAAAETVADFAYRASGEAMRMFCQYFPYANYEIDAEVVRGEAGFCFIFPSMRVKIVFADGKIRCFCDDNEIKSTAAAVAERAAFSVACRNGAFDIYLNENGNSTYLCSFEDEKFDLLHEENVFMNAYACLYVNGEAVVTAVRSYMDNGIAIADMRPIRYENGDIMTERGKVYLTASVRMHKDMFQGVFSWVPGTAEFALTGAVFYDCGDGKWCGDVAASVLYHRAEKRWYLWVCAFSHGHILARAAFDGDPRFGVNVIDVTLMEKAAEGAPMSEFKGFADDEDPDFFYDEQQNRWLMSICRINRETGGYEYVFFESDQPFDGYRCIGKSKDGCETGGSFVRVNGKIYFVCGNDMKKKSDYRIYSENGLEKGKFDFPDGGFRGWGTVMPIRQGSRTRLYWLTFDRCLGSADWNWSYGNLYCYEAERTERI